MTGSFTAITVTGTVLRNGQSGDPVPNAIVSFDLEEGMINGTTQGVGVQVMAGTDGTFTASVSSTADAGTTSEGSGGGVPQYHVSAKDPETRERIFDFRCAVPASPTTTTLATLMGTAD